MFQKNRKIKSNPKVCDLWIASNTVSPTTWYATQLFFYSEDWSKHTHAQSAMAPVSLPLKWGRFKEAFLELFYIKVNAWYAVIHLSLLPPFTNSRRPQLETRVTLPTVLYQVCLSLALYYFTVTSWNPPTPKPHLSLSGFHPVSCPDTPTP